MKDYSKEFISLSDVQKSFEAIREKASSKEELKYLGRQKEKVNPFEFLR